MQTILLVFLGGGIGSISRFMLSNWILQKIGFSFPYGTFLVNLIGCFSIGLLAGLPQSIHSINPTTRVLLVAGFLGGFTTFSAYEFEGFSLLSEGQWQKALFNFIGSIILGFLSLSLGVSLTRMVTGFLKI